MLFVPRCRIQIDSVARHRFFTLTQVSHLNTGFSPRHRFLTSTQVCHLDTGFSPRHGFPTSTQVSHLDTGFSPRHRFLTSTQVSHLDTGFSRFPCVYKQMLRWFPKFQVATTCFSCSPPNLNSVVTNFMFCIHVK